MAAQRYESYDTVRYNSFRGSAGSHRRLEPSLQSELERKIASQAAEKESFLTRNQGLTSTNITLRKDIDANRKCIERTKVHIENINNESDVRVRELMKKIMKLENDILAEDIMKKELQQSHAEIHSLIIRRQELYKEIQMMIEELENVSSDVNLLPQLIAERDGLKLEYKKLRAIFAHDKHSNTEHVEQLHAMEKKLISMSKISEKLQADLKNAMNGQLELATNRL